MTTPTERSDRDDRWSHRRLDLRELGHGVALEPRAHRIDSTVPARHRSTGRLPTEDHLAGEGLATSTCGRSSPQVAWASRGRSTGTTSILDGMRVALMHDLDTPTALAVVDARAARGPAPAEGDLAAIDALLGIRL